MVFHITPGYTYTRIFHRCAQWNTMATLGGSNSKKKSSLVFFFCIHVWLSDKHKTACITALQRQCQGRWNKDYRPRGSKNRGRCCCWAVRKSPLRQTLTLTLMDVTSCYFTFLPQVQLALALQSSEERPFAPSLTGEVVKLVPRLV